MKARFGLLVLAAMSLGSVGCGDDDVVPGPMDAGTIGIDSGGTDMDGSSGSCSATPTCPMMSPAPMNQMGCCCWRASNASRLTDPELRLAAVRISSPSSLASSIIGGLITGALDEERFNWLIKLEGAPTTGTGPATIKTGLGFRDDSTGTFAFAMGNATGMGSADRWDPSSFPGTMTGEMFVSPATSDVVTLPIFSLPDDAGVSSVIIELPLRGLELSMSTLSDDRSCIGRITPSRRYDTSAADLGAFLTVADSSLARLDISTIHATLCMLIAGMSSMPGNCADYPQNMWAVKPDALCSATSCTANRVTPGTCDPDTTCNAWELQAEFAAQGVEITN